MVKINQAYSQNFDLSARFAPRLTSKSEGEKGAPSDSISISEEGKKRHVLSQIVAKITEVDEPGMADTQNGRS